MNLTKIAGNVGDRVAAPRAPHGKYVVELGARPNYDFDPGTQEAEMNIAPKLVTVSDSRDAGRMALKFIKGRGLGMGNWAGFGGVWDDEGEKVGKVIYNGRVKGPGDEDWRKPDVEF